MKKVESEKLPPHSLEAEAGVLGCLMANPSVLIPESQSRFKCGEEAFYDLRHQLIYTAMLVMHGRGEPIDFITLLGHISRIGVIEQIGGVGFLSNIQDATTSPENFSYFADYVAEFYMQRKTLSACVEAAAQVYEHGLEADAVISQIELKLQSIRELRSDDIVVKGNQAGGLLANNLERRFNLKGNKSGIVTGLHFLDKITDGLQFGEQTIIGARPSQGKSALATTIIHRACFLDKVPTLVITLEMSIESLCRRILSNHCRIPMGQLRDGTFNEGDFRKFTTFNALMASSPIYFMDAISGSDSVRICQSIKRLAKTSGVKLVVIDYLQKIHATGSHEKRTYEVAQVSGALKAAAVASGCALLTLAQLNREPEQQKGRAPRLSDLADSSQIERDGDTIGLLERNREEGMGHEAKLHIAKQRDGECGVVPLHFEGQYCAFDNVSVEQVKV